ncbi:hypothetical protein HDU83_006978 [Entophlyctis luteolus]|nr:hypothetical protein HDU83_006978 [Entophlyctis luteolus]
MAILVPSAAFLNIQSLTVPLSSLESVSSVKRHWQLIATSVALGFGLIATVSDLLRMIEKKIKWSTRLIIAGSLIQGLINMAVVIEYCIVMVLPQTEALSPFTNDGIFFTFLSAICALSASFFCNLELQVNSNQHQAYVYTMNSLSPNQRQLTILLILLFSFLVISGYIYSLLEEWSLNEGIYFSIVVATSIGFGDLAPQSFGGKIFLLLYAPIGLGILGFNIYAVRQVLLETFTLRLADTFSQRFGMQKEHHPDEDIESVSSSSNSVWERDLTNLGSLVSERLLNEWIVTVGLIENRMGRYEVKARIKREWGVGAISNDGDVDVGSSAAAGRLSGVLPTHPRSAAIPRIVRITSPQYGRSAPSHLLQRRSLDLLHSDDEEEFSDPERTDESDDENVDFNSHAVGGQGLVSSPTREDEVRSRGQSSGQTPFLGRVRPMSMRVFPKRRSFLG